ncbi:MAG TPA: class II aldolase/adducin family protein [Candidatus Baltobacteraceae bacterium]|nr:class II aldolase/adducin family protein [Candidatus Baltobacteraceae bacterium]
MTETQTREELARYGRELWDRRLVTGSSGNLSARLQDGTLLVTPASRSLRDLAPHELVHTDANGTALDGGTPTSELPLHVACYRTRRDISCVIHTHPTFCVVWSKMGRVFEQDTVGARETLGPVTWTPYRPPGTTELADVVAEAAGSFDTIVMERHGLSVLAQTLERAFLLSDLAEEAARVAFFTKFLLPQ